MSEPQSWHGTTILSVRKDGKTVAAGDGQVSLGQTVIKSNATKVRRIADDKVVVGFAGATADAFTLFERLEAKLEQYPDQLTRACVELAKDWRTDRYLRRLEAMMAVADPKVSLILSGTGDVLEPEDGLIGIGSGGNYALAAARALMDREDMDAEAIARKAMQIAADICVYTNESVVLETVLPRSARAKSYPNSTATSSAKMTLSAPSPSHFAIVGGDNSFPTICAKKCCRRTF